MPRKKLVPGTRGKINDIPFEIGSGNVFADLGFSNAEEHHTKARLASEIARLVGHLPQKDISDMLGIDQPKASKLLRGQLRGFSTERLMEFLTRLGQNVEIRISPVKRSRVRKQGRIVVVPQLVP